MSRIKLEKSKRRSERVVAMVTPVTKKKIAAIINADKKTESDFVNDLIIKEIGE